MKRKIPLITFLILWNVGLFAQLTIKGKITDVDGLPIPGANVVIKGTTIGTVTDLEGVYTLQEITKDNVSFQEIWCANNSIKILRWTKIEVKDWRLNSDLTFQLKFKVGDTTLYITKKIQSGYFVSGRLSLLAPCATNRDRCAIEWS